MNNKIEADFKLLEAAAVAGERCPISYPHGPVSSSSITALVETKRIRSEVYSLNWRRVVILDGPNKGKGTAMPPSRRSQQPWMVNGVHVDLGRYSDPKRQQPWKPGTKIAP